MTSLRTFAAGFVRIFVSVRFLLVSILNYLTGNLIFSIIWFLNDSKFSYPIIATCSTLAASVFSYQTQSRILLKSSNNIKVVEPLYLCIQISSLLLSFYIVPLLSKVTSTGYIFTQFLWSAIISVVSILIIFAKKTD